MDNTRKFHATITTRYGLPEKDIYQQVIDLVKKENLAKSRAQLLLVKRGLQHTNNPEPLIKEKVVYRDRPGKTIEKVVYRDQPKRIPKHLGEGITEYVIDDHIKGDLQNTGQRASADKLTTRDKADPPSSSSIALKKKKSATKENGINGWVIGGGLGLLGLVLYLIFR